MGDRESELKLILVGESTVGKSCILSRFINSEFEELVLPTVGASVASKNIRTEKSNYKINIMDTAGTEQYRHLQPMYYREADICILVFDITNLSSFDSLPVWMDEVKNVVGNEILISLCGNKSDLRDNRVVEHSVAIEYAQNNDMSYYETSALNGSGINELFSGVIEEYENRANINTNNKEHKGVRINTDVQYSDRICC